MIRIMNLDAVRPEDLLNRDIQAEEDVSAAVDEILRQVRTRGDEALREYTKRFDGAELPEFRVSAREFDEARAA